MTLALCAAVGAASGQTTASGAPATQPATQPAGPKPLPITPPAPGEIERSLARGVAFLLGSQNADGSWGSAGKTKDLNIYAPVPGAHHAFRLGVTALCVKALIEAGGDGSDVAKAIDRGEVYLLEELPKLRRSEPAALYNNWAHAYGIRALVRMYARRPADEPRKARILELIAGQIDRLKRYESLNGGYGYLDFALQSQHSTAISTSFMTSTVLIALYEARGLGVHVPKELSDHSIAAVLRQQNPNFTYHYSESFQFYAGRPINLPAGSLGRSQVCNLALRLWGDTRITDDVLKEWLDRLLARNGWLSRARKFPVPHESWFQIAGYFFYYGHFYASGCIDQLPPADRPHFQDHLGRILLDLQEKDGSWWDYPMYNYGQFWGTPYAMMALKRCQK
jgi:hypothetical protein